MPLAEERRAAVPAGWSPGRTGDDLPPNYTGRTSLPGFAERAGQPGDQGQETRSTSVARRWSGLGSASTTRITSDSRAIARATTESAAP